MPASPHIRPSKDRDARAFYQFNRRIRVPAAIGLPVDRGIFMGLSRAFRFSTLRSTTIPGAMLPATWPGILPPTRLFFDALSSIRCFPGFPNPFSTPIRMPGISWCKRRNVPHSRPISIVPGCPRERSRLISRARSEKGLCICKIRAMFDRSSGITRSPHKEARKKHE
jgi:hypothetical protein